MSKHSPGPWVVDPHYPRVIRPPEWLVERIATVATDNAADARLIAAAPEMLRCVRYLASFDEFDNDRPPPEIEALAKELVKRIDG